MFPSNGSNSDTCYSNYIVLRKRKLGGDEEFQNEKLYLRDNGRYEDIEYLHTTEVRSDGTPIIILGSVRRELLVLKVSYQAFRLFGFKKTTPSLLVFLPCHKVAFVDLKECLKG